MIGAEQKMKLQENFEKVSSIWAFEEGKGEGRIYVANITVATCSPQGCVCSHHHQLNHHHRHHHHNFQPKIEKRVIWSKTLKRQRTVCEQRQRKRSKQSWKRGKEGLCRKKKQMKSFKLFCLYELARDWLWFFLRLFRLLMENWKSSLSCFHWLVYASGLKVQKVVNLLENLHKWYKKKTIPPTTRIIPEHKS